MAWTLHTCCCLVLDPRDSRNPALLLGLIGDSKFLLFHTACICIQNLPLSLQFLIQQFFTALPSHIAPGPLCNASLDQSNHSLFFIRTSEHDILSMFHPDRAWNLHCQSCTYSQYIPPWWPRATSSAGIFPKPG